MFVWYLIHCNNLKTSQSNASPYDAQRSSGAAFMNSLPEELWWSEVLPFSAGGRNSYSVNENVGNCTSYWRRYASRTRRRHFSWILFLHRRKVLFLPKKKIFAQGEDLVLKQEEHLLVQLVQEEALPLVQEGYTLLAQDLLLAEGGGSSFCTLRKLFFSLQKKICFKCKNNIFFKCKQHIFFLYKNWSCSQ